MVNVDNGKVVGVGRSRWFVALLIVCGLLATSMLHPHSTFAATHYYVDSVSGSDTNPGTTDRPWRTIQKAANTMVAGDTCHVRAGTYNERVQVSRSGASGAPIVYQAEGTVNMNGFTVRGHYITIRGFTITNTPNATQDGWGIYVEANNCLIENNYVYYATRGGILVWANPADWGTRTSCVIRNNRLYRNAMVGIEVHGRYHLVEGNEVWRTIQYHPKWTPAPSYADADGVRFFGSGHTFRLNYIHDITYDDAENVNPHIDCFQTWGSDWQEAGRDIVFERNWCQVLVTQTANESGNAFMLDGTRGIVIRNNVLRAFKLINTGGGGNSYLSVVNNTLTSYTWFPTSNNPQGILLESCPYSTVRNNILYDLPGPVYLVNGTSATGLNAGNNLVYRSDGQALSGSPFPGDLWGVNPQFVNAGGADYHLQSTSPAINKGSNLGSLVTNDYDGVTRPQGTGYDMGAFEYGGSPAPAPTNTPAPPPATPTPPSGEVIVDNSASGFTTSYSQDVWTPYVETGGQHYGGSHAYNHLLGTGQDVATWSFALPRVGQYAVYAWWWAGEWRPTDVPYVVNYLGGSKTVKVNQQLNGGQWNLLGSFPFAAGGSISVRDAATTGQDIVADAVRLVYQGPPQGGLQYRIYFPIVRRRK